MPSADFTSKREAARKWEEAFAAWARSRGYWVLPTYDFSGKGDDKAPKLLAPAGLSSLVMPDLQCFRDGKARWVECKMKASATLHRKSGHMVTGISIRLWRHYQLVERVTVAPVTIAFLHESEGEVRGGSLSELAPDGPAYSHAYHGARMGHAGMIFWKWKRLRLIAGLDEIRANSGSDLFEAARARQGVML